MSDEKASGDGYTFSDVSVVMGTYNEREAIGTVLADIERVTDGQAEVVCVDSSTDGTAEVAREHGARVIEQEPQGYGVAVQTAITTPDRPVVVTTDCDDTYPMDRLPDFLTAINDGYDVVSGDRLTGGAETMPRFNRLGNHAFAWLASALIGERVHDTTTGMRAYRREVIDSIEWTENTGLSAELLLRPVVRGYRVTEIPIDYRERVGETTLDPLAGGAAIAKSIGKVALEEQWRKWAGTEPPEIERTVDSQSR
ncbi:Glycosyl transferase family 2 [Halorhabdus sp. SVX81]|uniref:dolichyl-phosphate hexose transferase n=1 Tax=Halorhabdus sp. SVX81 TaxID=2978283 RepID=UPI0023DCEB0A|nr:dolichyl-phosphate hexose transferase [Halorhabdus sp. SVX81]WEL18655.1 Glycosyl transferase family 2 [Halorhabdus sp. SVX81]